MSNAVCRICGKPISVCSWEDKLCYSCRKKKWADDIKEQIVSGETDCVDYEDEIYCPYCGELIETDFEEPASYEDGDHEIECPECEKTFICYTSVSYSYSTRRKKEDTE